MGKIKDAKDIFKENEKKEESQAAGRMLNMLMTKGKIKLNPETEKLVQKFIRDDIKRLRKHDKDKREIKIYGKIFAVLFFLVLVFGAFAAIKFFVRYLF